MAHLIDKDALVAEIEKRIKELQNLHKENEEKLDSIQKTAILLCIDECRVILSFIDTLEVKEVDDEPECKIFPRPIGCYSTCKECPLLATNNKAQKGEKV